MPSDRPFDPVVIDVEQTLRPTKRPVLTREDLLKLEASLVQESEPKLPTSIRLTDANGRLIKRAVLTPDELLRLQASLRTPDESRALYKTPVETALSLLGATGHATAKALGAAIDKPGDARAQLAEFGKGLVEAPTLKAHQQSTPSGELERRTGQPEPTAMKLVDAVMDVGNLIDPGVALKAAGVLPVVAGTRRVIAKGDELARLAESLGVKGGASIDLVDDAARAINASGESAASLEAINRLKAMQARGESFVIRDRGGRFRPVVGADAVDYRPGKGEQFGIRRADGSFQKLADEHGEIPADVLLMLGGGTLGAAGGAAASGDSPIAGAIIGGLAGATAGAGAGRLLGRRTTANVAQQAAEAVSEAADDALRVGERVPGLGKTQDAIVDGGVFEEPAVKMTRPDPTTAKLTADDERVAAFVDRHAGLTPDDTKEIKDILFESDNAWTHRRMGMTWEQQAKLADDIDIRIDLPKGTALNAEEMRALRSKATGVLAKAKAVNEDLIDVAKMDDATLATMEQQYGVKGREALTVVREEEWLKAKAALQSMMGARSESARTLNSLKDLQRAREMGDYEFINKALKQGAGFEEAFRASMTMGTDVEKYKFLRSLAKPGAQDYWRWYYISNLLSGPVTHARNALGNASNLALDMVSAPVAAAFSKEASAGEALAQFPGLWTGVKDGLQKAAFAFRNGFSLDDVASLRAGSRERAPEVFGGRLLPNVVSRTLEATDQFFRGMAYQVELSRQAYTQAYRRGVRGSDLWTEVARITGDPDVDLVKRAKTYAERAVFRQAEGEGTKAIRKVVRSLDDKTVKLSDALSTAVPFMFDNRIARGLTQVPLGTFVMPFISTPINIWRAGAEFTPYGVGKGLIQGGREGAQVAARGAVGTSLLGLAAIWATEGKMTGAAPSDPQERDKFYADGKIPNAIKIGDRWVSYQMLGGPLAAPLSAVANSFDVFRQTGEVKAGEVIARLGNSLLSQSYLSGMMGLIEAVNRAETHGEAWAGRTVSGFIPAAGAVRAARNVVDPSLRDASTVAEHVQANVPGLSSKLPARIDYAGETVKRRGGIAGALINPIDISTSKPDTTRQAMADVGAYYTDPNRSAAELAKEIDDVTTGGPALTMTRQDRAEYARLYGQVSAKVMKALASNREFLALPKTARADMIADAKREITRQVREAFVRQLAQRRLGAERR